jgi:hypothetical protein
MWSFVVLKFKRIHSVQNTKPIATYHYHVPLKFHQVSFGKNTYSHICSVRVLTVRMQKMVLDLRLYVLFMGLGWHSG